VGLKCFRKLFVGELADRREGKVELRKDNSFKEARG
jgi:hypothetical protein